MATNWRFSKELAAVVEGAGGSVVSVHARPRFSSSGAFWRPGILVTASTRCGVKRKSPSLCPMAATPPPRWPAATRVRISPC